MDAPPELDRLQRALVDAATLHREQRRKGTNVPYVSHLLGVCSMVLDDGGDETEAIAALLHDAAEDQGGAATLAWIRERYGERVAQIVHSCSDSLEQPRPEWRPRKEAFLTRLRTETDHGVLRVEVADKLHNARSILRDLQVSGPGVWDRFSEGRDGQRWYYRALVVALRQTPYDSPLLDELEEVVTRLLDEG